MKKTNSPTKLAPQRFLFETLGITRNSDTPMFRQLETQLRDAIWSGKLQPGERLPSSRVLAQTLGIARNTIINAFDQLVVEGFLVTQKGSGTRVASITPEPVSPKRAYARQNLPEEPTKSPQNYHFSKRLSTAEKSSAFIPVSRNENGRTSEQIFRLHAPDTREFPKQQWGRLINKHLKAASNHWMEKNLPLGLPQLQEAICAYIAIERGIQVTPEQIVITAGAQQAFELLAKLFIDQGDTVCLEHPAYTPAARTFELAGAKAVSIPIDHQGIMTEHLKQKATRAKLIYVTPASHFPLGISMSQTRRRELLEWAKKAGAIIIEDDYNGEYRYRGRPLAPLHAMSHREEVIYISSFSKLLYPSLRLGFMVVPKPLLHHLANVRWLIDRHSPILEQAVLADFINQGYFASHLRRMRMLYAKRQQQLIDSVNIHLPHILETPPLDSGLHLVGWLKEAITEKRVMAAVKKANLGIHPTSRYRLNEAGSESVSELEKRPSILLGYAPFNESEIEKGVIALKEAL